MSEFDEKQQRMMRLLESNDLGALLLRRVSSFAWATCGGASHVNTAASEGQASLLVTRTARYLITDNIEAPRLEREEKLAEQGWEFHVAPWYEAAGAIEKLSAGLRLGADGPYPGAVDLSAEMARLRSRLTPEEGQRFRALGRLCAEAMEAAARAVRPGQSEYEISARMAGESERRGVQAIVRLVATDERIFAYRHPLPTARRLERYAMLILCGRREGLICSMTRLVHFGRLPEEVRRKAEAVAEVDTAFIAATRPGRTLGEVFQEGARAYERVGFPGEWQLHHQGGSAGYEPRELLGLPGSAEPVYAGQAYAWNPSITGSKSEDTILVSPQENEVLTSIPGWPEYRPRVNGGEIPRPAILEIL